MLKVAKHAVLGKREFAPFGNDVLLYHAGVEATGDLMNKNLSMHNKKKKTGN
jgi:hypothetical protein